jgi:hypothetical protein
MSQTKKHFSNDKPEVNIMKRISKVLESILDAKTESTFLNQIYNVIYEIKLFQL